MITQAPDRSIGPARLAAAIASMRVALARAPKWRWCEKYVDRGHRADPFYVFDIAELERHPGDVTKDEPLFRTHVPGLCIKQLTRADDASGQYWQAIDGAALSERLDHFLTMYRANELQPPGTIGRRAHEVFSLRRFIYRLRMPGTELVGFGPAAFAGQMGAVRGRVLIAGQPLGAVALELTTAEGATLRRTSDAEGRFWFSRVPAGSHRLSIVGHEFDSTRSSEAFGRLRGQLEAAGRSLADIRVELEAPDGERFDTTTSSEGRFDLGGIPASGYVLRVPDFSFTAKVTIVADARVEGVARDDSGVLRDREVILSRAGQEVARVRTNQAGEFAFGPLAGGRYDLAVADSLVVVKEATHG